MSLYVTPAKRRQRPIFTGGLGEIHPKIRDDMLAILREQRTLAYLDPTAADALDRARRAASSRGLGQRALIELSDQRCLWLTWTGTRRHRTLMALLAWSGVDAFDREVAIECRASIDEVRRCLVSAIKSPPSMAELSQTIAPKQFRKYDHLFTEELLNASIAADRLDADWRADVQRFGFC
jgi:ATP-dependent Lhr-like helicase